MKKIYWFLLALSAISVPAQEVHTLQSPDGRIELSLKLPAPDSAEAPSWSARFRGKQILSDCGLGLQTADSGELLAGTRLLEKRTSAALLV